MAKAPTKKTRPKSQKRPVAASAAPAPAPPKRQQVAITAAMGRPMLTWVGKRPLRHVTAFPAQHVETFDPSGGTPKRRGDLWTDWPESYPRGGLLFHGDNKEVLAHLLVNGFRGKANLIYIDPPFDSGADYVRKVTLRGPKGTAQLDGEGYTLGEQLRYTDIWANDNYLQFMYERLLLLKELLVGDGSIYLHCDSTRGHQLRCLMDEAFGADHFRNEIVWHYENKLGTGGQTFDSRHDSLLLYTKGDTWTHHHILSEVKEIKKQPVTQKIEGKRVWVRDEAGRRLYKESESHRPIGDVWTIPIINPVAGERSGFPTQKPEELLEQVITASSEVGDLVIDCFVGSGTTAAAAQKLGRRWIGCDINKGAIQTTSKRLQTIIQEQIERARKPQQDALEGVATQEQAPDPPQLSLVVYRVNDYDLKIQHEEAVNLACEHIGVTRTRTDRYFDGTLGKKLVKVVPFTHPLTLLDLEELKRELEARPGEERPIVLVCLGKEPAADAWIANWNRLRRGNAAVNRIEVIELRTDPKYGRFFQHQPARAKVKATRKNNTIVIEIEDFISPSIIERLQEQADLLKPKIDDWRAMVDCVMIDPDYDGQVFRIGLSDVPERKTDLVTGRYELPAARCGETIAVKIIDMLGEEVLVAPRFN